MSEEALMMSISHWQENLCKTKNKILPNLQADDCALCLLYDENDCKGCPIALEGFRHCIGTPYD